MVLHNIAKIYLSKAKVFNSIASTDLNVLCKCAHETVLLSQRYSGFFTRNTGESLWNSTSPTAKRTGRGKRAKVRKREDLGRGKVLGEGKHGMLWPGLNVENSNPINQRSEEEQVAFIKAAEMKKQERGRMWGSSKNVAKGWTGGHWGGVKLGKPEPIDGISYDDFESIIMDIARVSHMNNKVGRVYSVRAAVAVGNGNGLIGVSGAVAPDIVAAVRQARLKAIRRLRFIERFEDRTVFEDIYVHHHHTYMSISAQPLGYGLRCHRAVTDMCKLIGIKDLYVRTTGSTTMLNLTKCFLKGLAAQETYQEKADRLGYHVVQFDNLKNNYPVVLASPSKGNENTETHDDYNEYLNQKIILKDFKKREGLSVSKWSHVRSTDNRGPSIPSSYVLPDVLTNIRDYSV